MVLRNKNCVSFRSQACLILIIVALPLFTIQAQQVLVEINGMQGNAIHGTNLPAFNLLYKGIYGESFVGVEGISYQFEGRGVVGQGNGQQSNGVVGLSNASLATAVRGVCQNIDGWGGHFSGGLGLYAGPRLGVNNADPQYPIHVGTFDGDGNGAHVTGGGAWTNGSSRSFKEDFQKINKEEILQTLASLPIMRWKYKNSNEGFHIGPIAEDFASAFGLGNDPKYISTIDTDGIALAAIQALFEIVEKQQNTIERLQKHIESNKPR